MAERPTWVPEGVDESKASAARLYDYLLGGGHNFAVDRELADRFAIALPGAPNIAKLNRAFLRRAVLFLAQSGIRQFLDIGSGVPTVGNVHEIAQRADPGARVVYVDNEQVAVAHSQLILEGNELAAAIEGDLRDPDGILGHRETRRLLDFNQPIGLLMVGVLHFVPTSFDAAGLVGRYKETIAPGSYVALSHFTADTRKAEMDAMVEVMKHSKDPIYPRTRAEFTEFFTGLELAEPGVVSTADWRPDSIEEYGTGPERDQIYAGVGYKP